MVFVENVSFAGGGSVFWVVFSLALGRSVRHTGNTNGIIGGMLTVDRG